jgi:hypothetical protein
VDVKHERSIVMPDYPDGAQLSDDGNYWWDGTQWQPVQPDQEPGGASQGDSSGDEPVDLGFDPSQYPNIAAFAGPESLDDWLASIGAYIDWGDE